MAPLANYPDSFGSHRATVFPHTGPASYVQFTDTPVLAGDTVYASESGIHGFDAVIPVGLSDSGTYLVQGVAPAGNPSTSRNGAQATTWILRWVVVATGAEVAAAVNLSAEVVRLFALGRY